MCLVQGPQRSDAGEAQTHGLSVSSQALYHWATALPRFVGVLNRKVEMPMKQMQGFSWTCKSGVVHFQPQQV